MVYKVFLGKHPDNHPEFKKESCVAHPGSSFCKPYLNQSPSTPLHIPTSTIILISIAIMFFKLKKKKLHHSKVNPWTLRLTFAQFKYMTSPLSFFHPASPPYFFRLLTIICGEAGFLWLADVRSLDFADSILHEFLCLYTFFILAAGSRGWVRLKLNLFRKMLFGVWPDSKRHIISDSISLSCEQP